MSSGFSLFNRKKTDQVAALENRLSNASHIKDPGERYYDLGSILKDAWKISNRNEKSAEWTSWLLEAGQKAAVITGIVAGIAFGIAIKIPLVAIVGGAFIIAGGGAINIVCSWKEKKIAQEKKSENEAFKKILDDTLEQQKSALTQSPIQDLIESRYLPQLLKERHIFSEGSAKSRLRDAFNDLTKKIALLRQEGSAPKLDNGGVSPTPTNA